MARSWKLVMGLGASAAGYASFSQWAECDRGQNGLGELLLWGGGTGDCFGGGTTTVKLPRGVEGLPLVSEAALGCTTGSAIGPKGEIYAISRKPDSDTTFAGEAEKIKSFRGVAKTTAISPEDEILVATTKGQLIGIKKEDEESWTTEVFAGDLRRSKIADVKCGTGHCVALSNAGEVFSWGKNHFGQLGLGKISNETEKLPKKVEFPEKIQAVKASCGDKHTGVIDSDGRLWTFGADDWGQCGHSEEPWLLSEKANGNPRLVDSLRKKSITDIACGGEHTVAVIKDGTAVSFGLGRWGQLGHHNFVHFQSLHPIINFDGTGNLRAAQASAGANHSALITTEHALYTFGGNEYGQLAKSNQQPSAVPVKAKGEVRRANVLRTISSRDSSAAIVAKN